MKRSTAILALLFFLGVGLVIWAAWLETSRQSGFSDLPAGFDPQRIVCAAPSITEIVFALGRGGRVVGVSEFSNYPPEAAQVEKIGGIIDPNLERIVALKPDLVIVLGRMEPVSELCRRENIARLRVDMSDFECVLRDIQTIGDALGRSETAKNLISNMKYDLDDVRLRAKQIGRRIKVFLCVGRKGGSLAGLYTVNSNSFLNELLEIAGGDNIFKDIGGAYPQVSVESLLKRAPDVIIELNPNETSLSGRGRAELEDWYASPITPAAASGRVYSITDDYVTIPGPRMVLTARRFYELIHKGMVSDE
ncbi:MAG: ABC transporter substrate-binding protein [Candidatus Omnitrophota bacterium]